MSSRAKSPKRDKTPSKSPAAAKTPSKSPAAAEAKKGVIAKVKDFEHSHHKEIVADAELAVTVAILAAAIYYTQGAVSVAGSLKFFSDVTTKSVALCSCCSFNFFRLAHALSTCDKMASSDSGSTYWMNALTCAYFAAFSAEILAALTKPDTSVVNAALAGCPCSFFMVWFFVNQKFYPAWSTIKDCCADSRSGSIQLLDVGSTVYVANMVVSAASAGGDSLVKSVILGCVAGTACSFWPASKGISFENTAAHADSFAASAFVSGNGFALFDKAVASAVSYLPAAVSEAIPQAALTVGATINGFFSPMKAAEIVIIVTLLNKLFGPLLPFKLQPGFDMFGIKAHVERGLRLQA